MSRSITTNRRARHRYKILETIEAGIELQGAEVKSIRSGRVSLEASYGKIFDGEIFVVGMRIGVYSKAGKNSLDPERRRKLLLKRREIDRLTGLDSRKGLALVPLRLYFRRGFVKLELGVCRGKTRRDRREKLKRKSMRRKVERAIKEETTGRA